MSFPISQAYRKDLKWSAGRGYGRNIGSDSNPKWVGTRGSAMRAEVVHSTNNRNPTSIEHEAKFLRDSRDVSCNDLIGKDGTIYVILPEDYIAWHAGVVVAGYGNIHSFGTELHISVGEHPTEAQLDALTWRILDRITRYQLARPMIETHRAVALPKGRKTDPEGWSDAQFYDWRSSLFTPVEPDYATAWGPHYPYFAESGIAGTWRGSYRVLGQAMTDETAMANGAILRAFEHGAIVWQNGQGVIWR